MSIIWKVIKNLIWALLCGFLFMWASFWYLSGSPEGLFKFLFVYYTADHFYYKPIDRTTFFNGALKGMIESLDEPHSMYLTPKEYKTLQDMSHSSYAGIGIVIGMKDHRPMIISPIEDTPAAKGGLKSGDVFLKIDGKDTLNMTLQDVSSMVRGQPNTEVTFEVQRGKETLHVTIVRQKIVLPTVKSKMLTDSVGYIRITQFADATGTDFADQFDALQKKGMKKLILDLRDNPGGLVTSAASVSDYLVPAGPIVTLKTKSGHVESYSSKGIGPHIPLVVLVNHGSASASEIISAAVQDKKVGTVVGSQTYGKGTVQTVISGPDDDAVKLTIAKYHTPADRVIDGKGVTPDVVFETKDIGAPSSDDPVVQKGLEILSKK